MIIQIMIHDNDILVMMCGICILLKLMFKNLKCSKSSGIDKLTNESFKRTEEILLRV